MKNNMMSNLCIFLLVVVSIFVQVISSYEVVNDEQDNSINGKQINHPECLLKSLFYNMLSRDRRASISRPYFHHWRGSRDNSRYPSKNLLAFSPRLGKRDIEDEINVPVDFDGFLQVLINHLQRKKIDMIYDDSNKICFSESVSDALVKEAFDKFQANRRQQEDDEAAAVAAAAAARERQSKGKHPLLFRYRLG